MQVRGRFRRNPGAAFVNSSDVDYGFDYESTASRDRLAAVVIEQDREVRLLVACRDARRLNRTAHEGLDDAIALEFVGSCDDAGLALFCECDGAAIEGIDRCVWYVWCERSADESGRQAVVELIVEELGGRFWYELPKNCALTF